MLVSMSGDCCECVMTLTSREHQRVTRPGVTRGEGGDSPDRRHNYDREPGTGSGSSRDNRLELQRGNSIIGIVLPKCQASAQAPAAWPMCVIMIDLEIFTVRKHD